MNLRIPKEHTNLHYFRFKSIEHLLLMVGTNFAAFNGWKGFLGGQLELN